MALTTKQVIERLLETAGGQVGDATGVTFFRRLSKGQSAVEIGAELKALIDKL